MNLKEFIDILQKEWKDLEEVYVYINWKQVKSIKKNIDIENWWENNFINIRS